MVNVTFCEKKGKEPSKKLVQWQVSFWSKISQCTRSNYWTYFACGDLPSIQLTPSPRKPEWHVQLNDPAVSVQSAFSWQLFRPLSRHSLTGKKERKRLHYQVVPKLVRLALSNTGRVLPTGSATVLWLPWFDVKTFEYNNYCSQIK